MAQIVVHSPRDSEARVFPLVDLQVIIGRDQDVELPLDDTSISRRHARIFFENSGHYVEDLGSVNGISLNGQPVASRKRLRPGMEITVGDCLLEYTFTAEESARFALLGVSPEVEGELYLLPKEGESSIGRDKEASIVIDHASLSRKHASIVVDGPTVVIEDQGSGNGTRIGRDKIKRRAAQLGDHIFFGNIEMILTHGSLDHPKHPHAIATPRWIFMVIGTVIALGIIAAAAKRVAWQAQEATGSLQDAFDRTVRASIDSAKKYTQEGKWEEASTAYTQALDRDPINPDALKGLLQAEQDTADARLISDAKAAAQNPTKLPEAITILTRITAGSNLYSQAQTLLADLTTLAEKNWIQDANQACRQGQWSACQRWAAAMLRIVPNHTAARALIFEAQVGLDHEGQSFAPWGMEDTTWRRIETDLRRRHPNFGALRAAMRMTSGDTEGALQLISHAGSQGTDRIRNTIQRINQSMEIGAKATEDAQREQAMNTFEGAVALFDSMIPPVVPSPTRLAMAHQAANAAALLADHAYQRGDYLNAKKAINRGLLLAPGHVELLREKSVLEERAKVLLDGTADQPSNDNRRCGTLRDILGMIDSNTEIYKQAEQMTKSCKH